MSYNLFLDDERKVSDVTWVDLPLVEWVIVKNYKQFVEIIERRGIPLRVSFDNDLADVHYKAYFEDSRYVPDYLEKYNFKEKTGYDCAKWLVNYCLDRNLDLPEYFVHTMNVIGKDYITSVLESYKKSRK